eukprot:565098-Prorocentrum_minimum.AAC.2
MVITPPLTANSPPLTVNSPPLTVNTPTPYAANCRKPFWTPSFANAGVSVAAAALPVAEPAA